MRNVLAMFALVLVACGGGEGMRDSGSDAGTDAGQQPVDANTGTDAGIDAGPECAPNEMRNVDCGNCGLAQQTCSADGVWLPPGTCLAEGECAVAEVDMETTDRCGMRTRICDDACRWRDWTVMVPDGECVAGETLREASATCTVSEVLERQCSETCTLDAGACVDACGGVRRTTPADAEEVCIPAGPFIRGTDAFTDTQPVAEVMMSAYYIDRYPVTNDRYRACVNAGACPEPSDRFGQGLASFRDPTRGRHPVQDVVFSAAEAFCAWDGGRFLPTEAQWEKAARGPTPSTKEFPWGSTVNCAFVLCTGVSGLIPHQVGTLATSESHYGNELMVGGGFEWTRDLYDARLYESPLVADPVSTTGVAHTLRGSPFADHLSHRVNANFDPSPSRYPTAFRCARSTTDGG